MASISKEPGGRRTIQFVGADGKRRSIRLGKVPQRTAEAVKVKIEALAAASITGHALDDETARWLAERDTVMIDKLAAVGLVPRRRVATVGPFLQGWLAARKGDYKPASLIAWGQVIAALTDFLGADCPLAEVTPAKAEAFRQSMRAAGLRATTIHKRLQHARMFFAHARRQGLVDANPFEFVRHRPGDASERRAYVPAAHVLRAIEHAPNGTWKLLLALSRFAGLRVPSEALSLHWRDVDWNRGRLTVPSPKTEHLAGRGYRVIPLFPAIRPFLEAAWDEAPEGAEYVIPEEYRRRAQGTAGWANANLRTTLEKIIRRAGLEPWPRLWHSMRASCETDLARQFPLAVVAKWLGNTQAVAMRHYVDVDVTDADFERAIGDGGASGDEAVRNPVQQVLATYRNASNAQGQSPENSRDFDAFRHPSIGGVEAAGIEPASRDDSMQASTCVAGSFPLSPRRPPTDRVPNRLAGSGV